MHWKSWQGIWWTKCWSYFPWCYKEKRGTFKNIWYQHLILGGGWDSELSFSEKGIYVPQKKKNSLTTIARKNNVFFLWAKLIGLLHISSRQFHWLSAEINCLGPKKNQLKPVLDQLKGIILKNAKTTPVFLRVKYHWTCLMSRWKHLRWYFHLWFQHLFKRWQNFRGII